MDSRLAPRYHNAGYAKHATRRTSGTEPMSRPKGDHRERREAMARAAADVIASRALAQLTLRFVAAARGKTTGVLTHAVPPEDAGRRQARHLAVDRPSARATATAVAPLRETGDRPPDADPAPSATTLALCVKGQCIHLVMNAPVPSASWPRALAREPVRHLVTG